MKNIKSLFHFHYKLKGGKIKCLTKTNVKIVAEESVLSVMNVKNAEVVVVTKFTL